MSYKVTVERGREVIEQSFHLYLEMATAEYERLVDLYNSQYYSVRIREN